jgi:predicted metal-dependent phosphoesterase TrpH
MNPISTAASGRDRQPRGGGSRGLADMHIHSLYSDGTNTLAEILDHVERHTSLDVIAITDHERIDGALRARELHRSAGYSFDLVIGEEITTRRGHVLALFIEERIPALRPLEETLERIHAAGGLAVAAHPMAPLPLSVGRRSLLRVRDHVGEGVHLDAVETMNPSHAGWIRQRASMRLNAEELRLPGVGNSDAHLLEQIGTARTSFPGASADAYREAILRGDVEALGEHWSHWHNVALYGRQLRAKVRKLRHTLVRGEEWR